MKKIFTKLLIISIICAILSIILCIFSIKSTSSKTSQVLNEIQQEEIDDVEGYSYIVETSSSLLADIGDTIGHAIFIIFIPGFLLFMIVLSQSISRLIQIGNEKKWKGTASKAFTYISIVLQILLCLTLLFNIFSNLSINKILLTITLVLNIACVVIFFKELAKFKIIGTNDNPIII